MTLRLPAGFVPAGTIGVRLDRTLAFACVGVLAAINAEAGQLIDVQRRLGWLTAVGSLGGVSAVVWFALFAALQIGLERPAEAPQPRDIAMLGTAVLLAVLPVPLSAQAGLLLVGGYLYFTSTVGSRDRRLGFVLLALTGPLLWGRIVLQAFVAPLVALDARLVGLLIGSPVEGNTLLFAHSTRRFLIGGPCSSVHNISLAVLLWSTAVALFQLRIDRRLIGASIAAVSIMFAVNLARLSAIGLFPADFDFLHDGLGATLFGWVGLIGAGLAVAVGTQDAIARQR